MTYPKKTYRFNVQFAELANALNADPQRKITIQCASHTSAMKLRFHFYAFRNAARVDGTIADFPLLDAVEATVSKSGLVTFSSKDYSEIAHALNEGLRAAGIEPSITATLQD